MNEMGKAMMGTGEASGEDRAVQAAEKAIANPLLDGVAMKGAKGVNISITGGEDMRLMEVDEAASHIKELVDADANIIWGSAVNNDLDGKIRAASDILDMYRAFLVAPPGERLVPPAVEAAEQVQTWSRVLTDAKLEAATTRDERIKLLTEERDRAREFETQVKNLADAEEAGTMRVSTAKAAYYRADAEARLARAQMAP